MTAPTRSFPPRQLVWACGHLPADPLDLGCCSEALRAYQGKLKIVEAVLRVFSDGLDSVSSGVSGNDVVSCIVLELYGIFGSAAESASGSAQERGGKSMEMKGGCNAKISCHGGASSLVEAPGPARRIRGYSMLIGHRSRSLGGRCGTPFLLHNPTARAGAEDASVGAVGIAARCAPRVGGGSSM